MNLIVQKYGGSSVSDVERMKSVAEKISNKVKEGYKVIVVVSAMGKTTDQLIELAKSVSKEPDPREMDMLLTTGEQISAALLSIRLRDMGIRSKSFNAFQMGIKTTEDHTSARILDIDSERIIKELEDLDVVVITGFQGINEKGDLTTLGRGGSDTSAVAIAVKLGVPCEIYSDVNGIYTCDPRIAPRAKKLRYITYDDLLEMTSLGAKIVHSRAVELAKKYDVELYCACSFSEEEGTHVVSKLPEWLEQPVVTGVSYDVNQIKITVSNLPVSEDIVFRIFEEVSRENLNVDMISLIQVEGRIHLSFTILKDHSSKVERAVGRALNGLKGWKLEKKEGYAKVSIVGVGMKSSPGVASRFFKVLLKSEIKVDLTTTSEIKISSLIPVDKLNEVIESLLEEFDLVEER